MVYPGYDRLLTPGEGPSSEKIKEKLALVTRVLADGGVLPFTLGHCAARIPGGRTIYITPHFHWEGRTLQEVGAQDIRTMDIDGNPLDCDSIDIPEERHYYTEIFRARPDIGAAIHGHPRMSCAFAAAGKDVLSVFGTRVPIIPDPGFGDAVEKGGKAAEALGGGRAVVWPDANLVVGRTIEEACVTAFALEWEAERLYFVIQLGGKPEPIEELYPTKDMAQFITKQGFPYFEAMDRGPRREVFRKLFWH